MLESVIHFIVIVFAAIILAKLYFATTNEKAVKPAYIVFLGGLCVVFGIVSSLAAGRDLYELVILVNTSGFGRAYVGGLGIMLAGAIIYFVRLVKKD